MENNYHPPNQETKKSLDQFDLKNLINESLYSEPNTSSRVSEFTHRFLLRNHDKLQYYLNSKKNKNHAIKYKRSIKQLLKSHKSLCTNSVENIILDDIDKASFLRKKNSIKSLNKIRHIYSLPKELIKKKIFSGHITSQIIIHEKGSPLAESMVFTSEEELNFMEISANSFSQFFNLIKKSKLKLFNRTNIKIDFLDATGSFLAKELSLKHHNVILILSRNDFLPPDQNEQLEFSRTFSLIKPIIRALLTKRNIDAKYTFLGLIFEHIPFPIAILEKNNIFILKNRPFENHFCMNSFSFKNGHCNIVKVNSTTQVIFEDFFSASSLEDIYHFQRITLLGDLLNTLKHELSNPLFGINLSSNLLYGEIDNDEEKEMIGDITLASQRCQDIIENFSNLYDSESNRVTTFSLEKTIKEVLVLAKSVMCEISSKIIFKGIKDSLFISTYRTYLSQIIFNLVVNSAQSISKSAKHKDIIISVSKIGTIINISIIDSGMGIPKEVQKKLFNPFFTTKKRGTGLGLSISKNLAQKIDATIVLDYTSEKGTSFTIQLKDLHENSPH